MGNLAIIPARGGSKRIPGKNIRPFLGKPIIAYSIESAIDSGIFDSVMVSTDSDEIAKTAKEYGAEVPFLRSVKNADDHATLSDVVMEVIHSYKEKGKEYDNICCILPTAPFISGNKIKKGFEELISKKLQSVFPVIEFSYPIQRCLAFDEGKIKMVWNEFLNSRSQDLPKRFHDTGQYYWLNTKAFLKEGTLFTKNSGAIIISELEAQDIDTLTDWKLAEIKYELMLDYGKENTL
ncbi:pseudaminic acid cytidylyltransferase [Aquimarina litoralis]|uniref:pseudaminic acid cytidylyltransferase n=1 Tax=Aquimarina litoralis TaxID=584605 RepID=UPI001C58005E|nr:pseudaminic acid cytidylyltransferase [Aquimarina litoralis]MBW1293891.1 pseudaminic acid cytidylyltransferase [Aquimarina litoralis]